MKPIQAKILPDMAKLDRVYIPVFVFTDLGRQRESELALARFKNNWQVFYNKYRGLKVKYGYDIMDNLWPENFKTINELSASAESYIASQDLIRANLKLAEIRQVLLELRKRNGWAYYLDGLTVFDETQELMLKMIRGKPKLSDKDLRELLGLADQAQNYWQAVAADSIDANLFNFDENKIAALAVRIKKEQKNVALVSLAIRQGKQNNIFQTIQNIKPEFMVIYKAFGDFQPIFDQVIKERKTE